jgi:hypothetical protein
MIDRTQTNGVQELKYIIMMIFIGFDQIPLWVSELLKTWFDWVTEV